MDIFKFKKSYKKNKYILNPRIPWSFALITALLLIVVSVVYGVRLLLEINKDFNSESLPIINQAEKERKAKLDKAIEYFSDREKKSEKIINSVSPVVDPSN